MSLLKEFKKKPLYHYHLNTNFIITKNKNEQAILHAHPHHKGVGL